MSDVLLPDRIEFPSPEGMILKRAIIGIERAEKVDFGYPVPENNATIVTIEGGGRRYVRMPVDTIMLWLREPLTTGVKP